MRAALLPELPGLTKFYGLTPMDFEAMSLREITEYRRQMHKALDQQQREESWQSDPDG